MSNLSEENLNYLKTIFNILKQSELFDTLDEQSSISLLKNVVIEFFPADHQIFNRGDQANDMYIIKNGAVKIYLPGEVPALDQTISILSANSFFGEMALISSEPRNASAKVLVDAQLYKLNKTDFLDFMTSNPEFGQKISEQFLQRLKIDQKKTNLL